NPNGTVERTEAAPPSTDGTSVAATDGLHLGLLTLPPARTGVYIDAEHPPPRDARRLHRGRGRPAGHAGAGQGPVLGSPPVDLRRAAHPHREARGHLRSADPPRRG